MSLQELNEEISKLSLRDRLTLLNLIIQSLQTNLKDSNYREGNTDNTALINKMRGFLKTDQPSPSDAEVKAILEQRRQQKYLQ